MEQGARRAVCDRSGWLILALLTACGSYKPYPHNPPQSASGDGITAVAAAAAAASQATEDRSRTYMGWGVEAVGDTTRWRECTDVTTCTERLHEASSRDVEALRKVGRARPTHHDGSPSSETDVVQITLRPGFQLRRGGYASPPGGTPVFLPP